MDIKATEHVDLLGLDLLSGADSLIHNLNPEDEASISGGRGGRSRSRISRSRISRNNNRRSRLRSRRSRLRSRRRSRRRNRR